MNRWQSSEERRGKWKPVRKQDLPDVCEFFSYIYLKYILQNVYTIYWSSACRFFVEEN